MKITERGQVTIPKDLRDKYGITPAIDLCFIERENGLLLVKAGNVNPFECFRGIAKKTKGIPSTTDEYLKVIREVEK